MADRTRARVAIATLLILLTIAGARAERPSVRWAWPIGRVVVVGCVLEVVLAGLFIALRWRPVPRSGGEFGDDLAARLRKMLSAALVTGLIGVPLLIALTELNARPGRVPGNQAPRVKAPHALLKHHLKVTPAGKFQLGLPLLDMIIAILLAAIVAIALLAWRYHQRSRKLGKLPDLDIVEPTQDDLARAVQSGRIALREFDDARLAIIRCYVAMEHSLAQAGTERALSETPDELLARAVADGLMPQAPASLLTALFYEARFSSHPMPPSQRDQAEGALAELAARLPAGEFR